MEILLSAGTYYAIERGIYYSQTAYALMTGGCQNQCGFCSQSLSNSASKFYLSRVKWYPVDLEKVKGRLSSFKRFCLQTVVRPGFEHEMLEILKHVDTKKSVTVVPISREYLVELKRVGVDYLGIGLDTTEGNWNKVKKPATFHEYFRFIEDAVQVFGKGKVYVHLVYGLGEEESEFISLMETLHSVGAEVALFAFTPVKGTPMENVKPPKLEDYRKIQKLRFLIFHGKDGGEKAFLTSGCPSCDRPFYNEDPRGKPYNVPLRFVS
ncbi:radical SAM protein [Metallosphaera tengchongensis]|uniref:Radical SAM protein n=1 Tax=Metallosphaera tengchongensis TaxID=1532350 RepID=A0A6N0NUM3_9CREN|nr:radical SAM protein [Metallosphaera tengchongensis]QKQ99177.1 radical SAM protein [Metallosphaera tengchongensis]